MDSAVRSAVRNAVRDAYRSEKHPAVAVLQKFGTNAHCWIPGIGYFNGLQAGNYIDSAGTQAGLVDNPVGLAMDAANTALGAELVTNGNFSNGLTSWVVQQPTAGSVAVLAGECRFNSTDGSLAYIQQSICTVGRTYSVNLNVVNVSSGLLAISDGGGNYITFNTTGAKSFVFVATSSVFQVKRVSGVTDITIDNISVREVTGAITATQGTTANKPILRRGAVNLLTYSEQFDNAAWAKNSVTVTQNIAAAPNGTTSADQLIETATTNFHFVEGTISAATAGTYVFSCYLKQGTQRYAGIHINFDGTARGCSVDLQTGILGTPYGSATASIEFISDGWYRLKITATVTSITSAKVAVYASNSNALASYAGNVANNIYLWGAQLELGSTASEYIPTTTAAASSSSGNYYWQFDGSNDSLALSSVPFQMADDHCVVVGIRNATAIVSAWGISNSASNVQYIARVRRSATNTITTDWRDDATVAITHSTTLNDNAIGVISARNVSGTKIGRLNGVQFGTSSTAQGATTVNVANIGANIATTTTYWNGSIYPVIAIKGTVSDADLLILERWVGQMSGVSI